MGSQEGARPRELSLSLSDSGHFLVARFDGNHCPRLTQLQTRPHLPLSTTAEHCPPLRVMSTVTSPHLGGDSVFTEYETDLETLTTSISTKLSKDAREQRGGERATATVRTRCSWLIYRSFVLQRLDVRYCGG